jgi:hypothetical protein
LKRLGSSTLRGAAGGSGPRASSSTTLSFESRGTLLTGGEEWIDFPFFTYASPFLVLQILHMLKQFSTMVKNKWFSLLAVIALGHFTIKLLSNGEEQNNFRMQEHM